MTLISAHFGLPDDVPFLDVEVDRDTAVFLCPFTVRAFKTRCARAAEFVRALDSFMDAVIDLLARDPDGACVLLSQFKEPCELRLGYTSSGCDGHGAAEVLGARLSRVLATDLEAFVRVAVLNRLEDIQVFVNGVGNDVVSDMAGRISLAVLVDYTTDMMAEYPQLANGSEGTIEHTYRTWDDDRRAWVKRSATLPRVGGRALVLVPKLWTDANPIVSKERFLDLTSMTVLQETAASIDGKPTPKAKIKEGQRPFSAAEINLRVAREQLEELGRDLLRHFHAAAMLTLQRRVGLTA